LRDKRISRRRTGDILSEDNKWESLASVNIKRVIGAKQEKLVEALAIWVGQFSAKNSRVTDGVIERNGRKK
jgi:hypothetical protein